MCKTWGGLRTGAGAGLRFGLWGLAASDWAGLAGGWGGWGVPDPAMTEGML